MTNIRRLALLLPAVLFAPTQVLAGEKIMVVFDASGSMWGQIDGVSKIQIARDTLKRTIRDWKGLDLEAGLIVYGHRRKGDCADIEMKLPAGPIDTRSFSAAVDKINPRGKTPLTAAVRQAAEALKYTEEKATVILLSDGKETCDLDPCAVASELERTGVDFTAHVIGFDVAGEEERRQLRCLAENTGGLFVSAKDANELSVAFLKVVEPRPFAFVAVNEADGGPVPGPVDWTATGGEVRISQTTPTARLDVPDLPNGSYEVAAVAGPFKGRATFDLGDDRPSSLAVPMVAASPEASLDAPDTVPAGEAFKVGWQGPSGKGDKVQLARPGAVPGSSFIESHDATEGSPLTFRAPAKQGRYELRYFSASLKKLLARRPVSVGAPKPSAFLEAIGEIPAGHTFEVKWSGPGHKSDWLGLATPKMRPNQHKSYVYVRNGNPLIMRAPSKPGAYELRYVNGTETKIMGRRPLRVVPADMDLAALDSVKGGQTFEVAWKGPGHESDWLGLAAPKMKPGQHKSYVYVRNGNPLKMRAPTAPGKYELRYIHGGESSIMARRKLTVEPAGVTLAALDEVAAAQTFEVAWKGPGHQSDWIALAAPKMKPGQHKTYVYVRNGNPVQLRAPSEPGQYELRYINGSESSIMARRKLTVAKAVVTLNAVDEVAGGASVEVEWQGPGGKNDHITIAQPKSSASRYETYDYVRKGNPLSLQAPSTAGQYELRYINGSDRAIMARRPLNVTELSVGLEAVDEVRAGYALEVKWSGPGYDKDYVTLATPGSSPNKHKTYEYVRKGNPLMLRAPSTTGKYELRYIAGGDRTVLARRPLTVTPSDAALETVEGVPAGHNFEVKWSGPGLENDFLTIATPKMKRNERKSYVYVRKGNPVTMRAPSEPGNYEVRYINGNDRAIAARRVFEVGPTDAGLEAVDRIAAGRSFEVRWAGPGYNNDWLAIARPDMKPGQRVSYVYVRRGNPVEMRAPAEPGTYEIRYLNGNDRLVLAKRAIIVEASQ